MAEKPPRYNRDDNPPAHVHYLHVLKIEADTRVSVTVLSHKVHGYWWHYDQKKRRSYRCEKQTGKCGACDVRMLKKWAGFVHVHNDTDKAHQLLELTILANSRLVAIATREAKLRGLKLFVCRERPTTKSAVKFTYLGVTDDETRLPPALSPEPTLDRIWLDPPSKPKKDDVE